MNTCLLVAEIIQEPQLRYTSETNTAVAEMVVQVPGLRPEDPPGQLRAVAWGSLAEAVSSQFHPGEQVLLEGRLGMPLVERPGGTREKRAELTISRVHRVTVAGEGMVATQATAAAPVPMPPTVAPKPTGLGQPPSISRPAEPPPVDDIPF